MSRIRALTFALLTLSPTAALADSLFDVNTLVRTRMIADLEAAPSGDFVVVRVSEYAGGERWQSDYHQVWSNGATVRLTTTGKHYGSYAIAPDGKAMVFAGDRDGKEGLYILPLERGEARLLAEIPVDIDNLRWTRGGIFFTAMVSPSCAERHDFACTRKKLDEHKGTTSALVFDTIGHRPWNMWRDGTVSNLFAIDPATRRVEPVATGNFDIPMVPLGGKEDYVASEDGRTVIYAAKEGATHALTTNHDLYEVTRGPDGGPFGAPKKLTPNKGADTQPVLSPDGTKVAYLAQAREYLESDLWRLHVLDRKTGKTFTLADKLDRWVSAVSYGHDGRLYLHYETGGYHPLASIEATEGAELRDEATKIVVRKLAATPKTVWYTRESMTTPPELWGMDPVTRQHRRIANFNADVLAGVSFGEAKELRYDVKDGKGGTRSIHGFLVTPPGGAPAGKKLPLVVVVHGGPQGSWLNSWHVRWHPMVFASMGFALALPNFTGSTGYGQAFVDAITRDWGGKPYEDVMALLDAPEVNAVADGKNACAIGGSYGGYMTNWIGTHNDRFKCLVSHASVFNFTSKYGTTDEMWFPHTEYGGKPWEKGTDYDKWSPHLFMQNWKTPVMVVHGARDYRVPVEQGLAVYQNAKLLGVEAKLVYFPDEDHFVNKPKNRKFWYTTVGDWMKAHLMK